ncbi:unnamed protein product [Pleuronectes platessa]|uniref:Uncharacterized protein n=1 Tax=Pleuronectes platessa TaxID=8262 RepID=A0A9N7YAY6_PLEPL|nr:unnamed protein product [Pleuronectes platessa]
MGRKAKRRASEWDSGMQMVPLKPHEIMELDSSPLHAVDITPDLKKQFAFLSGGRGDNGSPIIVFPEFPCIWRDHG